MRLIIAEYAVDKVRYTVLCLTKYILSSNVLPALFKLW